MRRFLWFWVACLIVQGVSGCSLSSRVVTPEGEFSRYQDQFMQHLRWRDYPGAAQFFEPQLRNDFMEKFSRAGDLNMTDVRLEMVQYDAAKEQMETELVIEYFLLPSATVKTFRLQQQWRYFRQNENLPGEWRISSLFPAFPGLELP